ncbi:hypothetical protein [Streptomyces hirsutus]|nr:hypothetical protein [Streptomyces hirsutus]
MSDVRTTVVDGRHGQEYDTWASDEHRTSTGRAPDERRTSARRT